MHASFFFSSRRRHTRWPRDWSSDVCSSDLYYRRIQIPEHTIQALRNLITAQFSQLHATVKQERNAHVLERERCVPDRKSTRLNSSHVAISYAVFCLKKKKNKS